MEDWRHLLYPIGYLANLLYALRFFLQWINSEKAHQSHFSPSFWSISLYGSLLMAFHSFIQVQYPVCLIQSCNAMLYWRNFELMRHSKQDLMPLSKVHALLALLIFGLTTAFIAQSWLAFGELEWMRVPNVMERAKEVPVSITWNLVGFCGTFLFASRFWIHWWRAEKDISTALRRDFWLVSVIGSLLALSYFIRIKDLVNIIGYGAGMVPYIRNLMLMNEFSRSHKTSNNHNDP